MKLGISRLRGSTLALSAWLACVSLQAQSAPDISVAMDVACFTLAGCETNWSKQAAGLTFTTQIGNEQCPAFCYRITVTNSGSAVLRNVTVNDTVLGELTALFNFPTNFSPGDF